MKHGTISFGKIKLDTKCRVNFEGFPLKQIVHFWGLVSYNDPCLPAAKENVGGFHSPDTVGLFPQGVTFIRNIFRKNDPKRTTQFL